MTNRQVFALLAAAAIAGIVGLVLVTSGDHDVRDYGGLAFAVAVVLAVAGLADVVKRGLRA